MSVIESESELLELRERCLEYLDLQMVAYCDAALEGDDTAFELCECFVCGGGYDDESDDESDVWETWRLGDHE